MPQVCSFYGIKIYIYWDDHPGLTSMPDIVAKKWWSRSMG
jgi:hypothetical protein